MLDSANIVLYNMLDDKSYGGIIMAKTKQFKTFAIFIPILLLKVGDA